jgi:ribosome biogenesis protein ENP2
MLYILGLILFANDDPKVLQYFVPSLGPAPKWCSHLDSITEELEENDQMESMAIFMIYLR